MLAKFPNYFIFHADVSTLYSCLYKRECSGSYDANRRSFPSNYEIWVFTDHLILSAD